MKQLIAICGLDCSLCEIRKCAVAKGFEIYGDGPEKDTYPKVGAIWQNNPQAKASLG